jgi:gamma-glutamyltranspeptidase / glutathione hydrolase
LDECSILLAKHRDFCAMKRQIISVFILTAAVLTAVFRADAQTAAFPYDIQKEATGKKAMVVSAHPLATRVGIDILKKGGNAVDATVAVQFALAVVYPQAGNIGGGGFLLYRDRKGNTASLDYREKAPAAATETMYQDKDGNVQAEKSRFGALASGVPGTVDGMWTAHQKYGKLPWQTLVRPAVDLAEKGFQITEQEANNLNRERERFIANSSTKPVFASKSDWKPGDWLIQTDLANTFKRILEQGRDGFYTGATAALIEYEMKQKGGLITAEDLKNYHSAWRTPLEFDYRGMRVITMPPPSSGGLILQQLLTMMEQHDLRQHAFHSPEAIHLMVEAERRAYADRAEHMGDPDFWKVPVKGITHPAYLKTRMSDFRAAAASPSGGIDAGKPAESEQTTHFSIVDRAGNAASVTTTLNDSYGCRTVVAGAGFILNNEMDDFSAKPGAPNIYGAVGGKANAIQPGKRPLSSMTPTILTKNGKLRMIVGTPGGTTIPTSVFQVIVNVTEFGLSLPEAVQNKRFHHQWKPDVISVEEGAFPEAVAAKLGAMGHKIATRGAIGRVEAVIRVKKKWQGVADRRGDDAAMGW